MKQGKTLRLWMNEWKEEGKREKEKFKLLKWDREKDTHV